MTTLDKSLAELAGRIRGQLITPSDAAYDTARQSFNATVQRRPAAIARCLDAGDVVTALGMAREAGLSISVRGGGHNVAGHALIDDGLVIDLSPMRAVIVDPETRVARAGGGCRWLDFDTVTLQHGLATPGGTFVDTGIGGLTLGGGIGWLHGTAGLTCDNLIGAELVTADGRVVEAADDPELLWGLRGGGGNFGVVTRFDYRLHAVGPLQGGNLVFAESAIPAALRRFRDVMAGAPDALYGVATLTHRVDNGERILKLTLCDQRPAGPAAATRRELVKGLDLLADETGERSYAAMQALMGQLPFGLRHYWKGYFVRELPDSLTDVIAARFAQNPGPVGAMLLEPLHGVTRRIPPQSAAFGQRHAAFNVSALAIWESPDDDAAHIAWARSAAEALVPYATTGGGYLNYMGHDEPVERVRAAFGAERFARLAQLKARYDPSNVFRSNQNVPPGVAV
ncbi:MAG TPA: FAD-binding oxidoreductase [Candidatus Limnocylindrales bacterium]|nr:FAD-binding oxidoreductase [Candidatus Limnocylindrales bacterium]